MPGELKKGDRELLNFSLKIPKTHEKFMGETLNFYGFGEIGRAFDGGCAGG